MVRQAHHERWHPPLALPRKGGEDGTLTLTLSQRARVIGLCLGGARRLEAALSGPFGYRSHQLLQLQARRFQCRGLPEQPLANSIRGL